MSLKKLGIIFISAFAALSLCACSNSTNNDDNSETTTQHVTLDKLEMDIPSDWSKEDGSNENQVRYWEADKAAFVDLSTNTTTLKTNTDYLTSEQQFLDFYASNFPPEGEWEQVDSGDESDIYQAEVSANDFHGYIRVIFSSNYGSVVIAVTNPDKFSEFENTLKSIVESAKISNASKPDFSANATAVNEDTEEKASKASKETTKYQAGSYRVGKDIPAGEYKIYAEGSGYFCVYPDTSKSKILENDNFDTCNYITVSEGQLLEVDDAYFVAIEDATKTTVLKGNGVYKVGLDIEAGEYNIKATRSNGGYYEILSTVDASVNHNIVDNDNFTGNSFVSVSNGQYLGIGGASIENAD